MAPAGAGGAGSEPKRIFMWHRGNAVLDSVVVGLSAVLNAVGEPAWPILDESLARVPGTAA